MSVEPGRVLAEHYGISGAELRPTELGVINDNYFVTHQGREYVLKHYRPEHNPPEHVDRVCRVQEALRASGVPTPELIPNRRGETVTRDDCACYVLSVRAPGRHYERGLVPVRAATAMGRALGLIHALLEGVTPTVAYTPLAPNSAIAQYRSLLELAERGTGSVDQVACQVLRYRIGAIERLASIHPRIAELPSQWVHGDYQLTNILFDDSNRVTAVLDFDNLRCRPRGLDFLRAMDLCFERRPDGLSEQAIAFFRGYAEIVRPLPAEVSLYGSLGAYWAVAGTWPIGTRYLDPRNYQPRWDRYIVPPSDWWERNMNVVTEQLLATLASLPAGTNLPGPNLRISADVL